MTLDTDHRALASSERSARGSSLDDSVPSFLERLLVVGRARVLEQSSPAALVLNW